MGEERLKACPDLNKPPYGGFFVSAVSEKPRFSLLLWSYQLLRHIQPWSQKKKISLAKVV